MFERFEKGNFHFFSNFWVAKLKTFCVKIRQSAEKYLNKNLVIGSFLETIFEAILSSKTNVVSVWKEHFSDFFKFLSDKVETIFCESKTKSSKLFKSKCDHRNLLRKWFSSYLKMKNECSEGLKRAFFFLLQIFALRSRKSFLRKWGKAFKSIYIKIFS